MKLQQRQARETGICPVRRELYTQCFGKDLSLDVNFLNIVLSKLHLFSNTIL